MEIIEMKMLVTIKYFVGFNASIIIIIKKIL